jgi:hypothetical protein
MPLTLALTPDDRRWLAHAGEQWRLLRDMPFECRSIPTAEYLLEHGRHIAGSSELLGRMFRQLECDVERAVLIGVPMEATERRRAAVIHVRWLLCQLYVENLIQWNEAAQKVMREWRFRDASECEVPELPKLGWQQRDLMENTLEKLKHCTTALPVGWGGSGLGPVSEACRTIMEMYETGAVESGDDGESGSGSESEGEDEFVIFTRPMGDVFPGGDDEGRESSFDEEIEEEATEEEFDAFARALDAEDSDDEESDGRESERDVEEVLRDIAALDTEDDTTDDEDDGLIEWRMPNRQAAPGEFSHGHYVPSGDS